MQIRERPGTRGTQGPVGLRRTPGPARRGRPGRGRASHAARHGHAPSDCGERVGEMTRKPGTTSTVSIFACRAGIMVKVPVTLEHETNAGLDDA